MQRGKLLAERLENVKIDEMLQSNRGSDAGMQNHYCNTAAVFYSIKSSCDLVIHLSKVSSNARHEIHTEIIFDIYHQY